MDLTTTFLGLELKHPFMPGASPLVNDLDQVMELEDADASAIVMHSLFEEQIIAEQMAQEELDAHRESFGEALSFFPRPSAYHLGAYDYLEQMRKIKERVSVPVIGSLNGTSKGGWVRYAKMMEEAGADALELNIYFVATDPAKSGEAIEQELLDLVKMVKAVVSIPVGVKLSPFFTSLPHMATKLDELSIEGIILFNRFFQPDIDVEELKVVRTLRLSHPAELLLRLHGLAVLSGRIQASLAVSGGIHSAIDATKALMSGANAVQIVSALLRGGVDQLKTIRDEAVQWAEENEYESFQQMIGSMSLEKCPDPKMLERLNYIEILKTWRHVTPAV